MKTKKEYREKITSKRGMEKFARENLPDKTWISKGVFPFIEEQLKKDILVAFQKANEECQLQKKKVIKIDHMRHGWNVMQSHYINYLIRNLVKQVEDLQKK